MKFANNNDLKIITRGAGIGELVVLELFEREAIAYSEKFLTNNYRVKKVQPLS